MPDEARSEKLYEDAMRNLEMYSRYNDIDGPASQRLAFRECGLSLGIRVALREMGGESRFVELERYRELPAAIEAFWSRSENQTSALWQEHEDINAVSLAASLTASVCPRAFALLG